MIIGIGIDIVKVDKMRNVIEKWGDDFINRIFNEEEIRFLVDNKIYYQRLAARFAAKEAVIKAVSSYSPLSFKDIIILNQSNGAPYCKFKNGERITGNINVLISLTHIDKYAMASAVAYKNIS